MCSALVALFIGALAGYGLARYKYHRVKNRGYNYVDSFPAVFTSAAVVIPFFLIFKTLGLIDSVVGLVLINATFGIPLLFW